MDFGACFLPIGLFLYGWTAEDRVQYMAPIVGTRVIGFRVLLTVLPTENYLVDVYELHGASAVGAAVVMRALFGRPAAVWCTWTRVGQFRACVYFNCIRTCAGDSASLWAD